MKEKAKRIRGLYIITLACYFVSALSLVLISITDAVPEDQKQVWTIIIASLFWAGLIAGIVFTVITCMKLRPIRKELYRKGKLEPIKAPGVIRFGKDPLRIALYVVMIIGAVTAMTDFFRQWMPPVVLYLILMIVFIAFVTHCIIDGKNFCTYKHIKEGKEK